MITTRVVLVCILFLGNWSFAAAMGEKPPAAPEASSPYKLEVLKMEIIPASSASLTGGQRREAEKKALLVIAPKNFSDLEYSKTREILESKGITVATASSDMKDAKGMRGLVVAPDLSIKEARATDFDAVVFIGGSGATVYKDNPFALSLAIEAVKNGKTLGAICLGPTILAKAGVVKEKKVAVSSLGKHILKDAGAVLSRNPVEIDGKIITGSGPQASEAFAEALVESINK